MLEIANVNFCVDVFAGLGTHCIRLLTVAKEKLAENTSFATGLNRSTEPPLTTLSQNQPTKEKT